MPSDKIELEVDIIPKITQAALQNIKTVLSSSMTGGKMMDAFGGNLLMGGASGALSGASLASVATASIAATIKMGEAIVALTRVSNPGKVELMTQALEDFEGVVGRFVAPIVDGLTERFRLWGDTMATILPSSAAMRELAEAFDPVMKEFRKTLAEIGPLIKDVLVWGLHAAAVAIRTFSEALAAVMGFIRESPLGRFLASLASHTGVESSVGAAARGASFVGTEDIGRNIILGALQRGTAEESAKRTADATERTAAATEIIAGRMVGSSAGFGLPTGYAAAAFLTR